MQLTRVHNFLHQQHVPFEVIGHDRASTAQETAANAHIQYDLLAKTVMVKLDDELVMVVLPATRRVHLGRLRDLTSARRAKLATEAEFRSHFPDCEVGAMPPFGNLYGMDVFVDESLAMEEDMTFNDGTHTHLVRVPFEEFERLVDPIIANLSFPGQDE